MSQPYKVCARCGQPAVLHMVQCGRCGLPFPPIQGLLPTAAPVSGGLSAGAQREIARAQPGMSPRRRSRVLPLLLLLGVLAVVAVAANRLTQAARTIIANVGTGIAGATAPPDSGGMSDPTAGVFQERPGTSEKPTIILSGNDAGTLTLVLHGEDGSSYKVVAPEGQEGRLQVPAGHYTLTISSSLPTVAPNYGDATFRRFKEYEAHFEIDEEAPPVHLGD